MAGQKTCVFISAASGADSPPRWPEEVSADYLVRELIEPAVAQFPQIDLVLGYDPSDGWTGYSPLEDLVAADLIIADITVPDPEIMLQIGITHGGNKPLILLVSEDAIVPTTLHGIRFLSYKHAPDIHDSLVAEIAEIIANEARQSHGGVATSVEDLAIRIEAIATGISDLRINSLAEYVQQLNQIGQEVRAVEGDSPQPETSRLTARVLHILLQIDQVLGSSKLAKLVLSGALAGLVTGGGLGSAAVFTLSLAVWDGPAAFKAAIEAWSKQSKA
jgi:hypothetical protein